MRPTPLKANRPDSAPTGFIAYHRDGRMMATVYRRDRLPPKGDGWTELKKAPFFDDMLAYVASYTLEGDRVVHHVDEYGPRLIATV